MASMTVRPVHQSSSAAMNNQQKPKHEGTSRSNRKADRVKADDAKDSQKAKSLNEEEKEQKISDPNDDNTNSTVIVNSMKLSFSVDEKTEQIVVTVLDTESGKEIRQIPSDEVLEMARMLEKFKGQIVNRTL